MQTRKNPRYQGRITSWKDEQGFGFITPNGGGPEVFVHIKSFASRAERPAGSEIVTYELTVNDKGQPRAANVAFVRSRSARPAPRRPGTGSLPLLAAAGFVVLLAMLVVAGMLPAIVLGACLAMSVISFGAYAADKAAARANRRRTPESTLHLLALAGGWPGALLAQRVFRHKTTKPSFRGEFWCTVAANCVLVGWLATPSGARAMAALLGAG